MGVGTAIEILFNDDGNDRGRAEEESDADGAKENDLCKHTVVQLKDMLRGKGLVVSGRKSELIQRLEEAEKREGF